jgi:hypothetical protein
MLSEPDTDIYRLRKEPFGFDSPFDTSGRTGRTARAEVSKREHIADITLRRRWN